MKAHVQPKNAPNWQSTGSFRTFANFGARGSLNFAAFPKKELKVTKGGYSL